MSRNVFNFVSEERIVCQNTMKDLLKSAYELGFYGDGDESDLPVGLSVEMKDKWLVSFRDGVRDEQEEADIQKAIYREQASLYGDD